MKKIKILFIAVLIACVFLADSCVAGIQECGTCDGTGKCNRCGGTGWAIDWDLECDTCGGTGDCRTCYGSGYIDTGIGDTGVPGFELVLVICAIAMILFLKRKKG